MNSIVIGLGNPVLSDDGVGPRVAAELKLLSEKDDILVKEANTGGLGLLDLLAGYDRAIIIDAIQMAVFAGLNDGAGWCANRIGNATVCKKHALIGDAINVGCFVAIGAVRTNGLIGMIIRKDE